MLSTKALIGLTLALLAAVFAVPFHLLFLARFPLVFLENYIGGRLNLAGVLVDPTDLLFGLLLLAYLVRGRKSQDTKHRLPYMIIWLCLGLLISVSYMNAPGAQEHLTALHRYAYQLYRYCWKTILFLPLGLLLINSRMTRERALLAIVLTGDLIALHATIEVYGLRVGATGPFNYKNALAASLVAPFLLSLVGALLPRTRFRLLWIGSSLLILRGILFAGSRGGTAAVLAGTCFFAACLFTSRLGRARLARLVTAVLLAGILALWIRPDLPQRPTVRKAATLQGGLSDHTMQWRMTHRWPAFVERIKQRPWLGYGTDVDPELDAVGGAATPHNGYLALAVTHGVPAALLYCLFALLAVKNSLWLYANSEDAWESAVGLVLASALVGILVHNLVDATIRISFVRDQFWLICALSAHAVLVRGHKRPETAQSAPARALVHGLPH